MATLSPLKTLEAVKSNPGPLLLIIMDGVGIGPHDDSNAVHLAHTPFLDECKKSPLYTQLKAHGKAVGMPTDADMGNSEVGHNVLGAGRVFDQGAALVNQAIESDSLFTGAVWNQIIESTVKGKRSLHFIGLLSDGNVHSHISHLKTMITKAAERQLQCIRVHILLDGRDVENKSSFRYVEDLSSFLNAFNDRGYDYKIASGGGRMTTTMDRYNADWPMVERGWKAHVLGEGRAFSSALDALNTFYAEDPSCNDQYLPSFVIQEDNKSIGPIEDGDGVILFNFRGDRMIELSQAFESKDFKRFDRKRVPQVNFAGLMQYDGDLNIPSQFLVEPPKIQHTLSHYLAANKIASFALSETQKYGHVTYFWNGNNSGYINQALEDYIEIDSYNVPFDQKPDMKAFEITEKAIDLLRSKQYKFGRVNFPNGDMVGHTGSMEATIQAVETTDKCVKKLVDTVLELKGTCVILADHGNADQMFSYKNGKKIIKTSHTLNPVPCTIIDSSKQKAHRFAAIPEPGLANVASTLCHLLGLVPPPDYEPSLLDISPYSTSTQS